MNEDRCTLCWKKKPLRYMSGHIDRVHPNSLISSKIKQRRL